MTWSPDSPDRKASVPKREPSNVIEEWAVETLVHVAGLDPDHAAQQNGVGFDRFDSDFGSSLAGQFQARGQLSDKQWLQVIRLARKYRSQAPNPEPASPAQAPPSPAQVGGAARLRELEAILDAAQARITAIESDQVAPEDPAYGARCYRGRAPEDGRAYVCPGCPYRIGGEMAEHRNAVCRGIEFMCQTQAEIAEIEGRMSDAGALRRFVAVATIEEVVK